MYSLNASGPSCKGEKNMKVSGKQRNICVLCETSLVTCDGFHSSALSQWGPVITWPVFLQYCIEDTIYRWVSARKTQLQQWSYGFFALTHRYFASDGKVWGVNCAMISVFLILHNAAYNTAISAVEYISQIHAITVTSHECHGVSNRLQLDCLFNNMFQLTTPALLRANNAERVSLPWYHHVSDTKIDPSHKFHNAFDKYPTVHQVVKMCTHFCYRMVHCGIWDGRIVGFEN